MCGRSDRLAGWAAALLVLCLAAVGVHFLGESLTAEPAGLAAHAEHDLTDHLFLLTASAPLYAAGGSPWGASAALLTDGPGETAPPTPPPDS